MSVEETHNFFTTVYTVSQRKGIKAAKFSPPGAASTYTAAPQHFRE
jgi:hypothetical protein